MAYSPPESESAAGSYSLAALAMGGVALLLLLVAIVAQQLGQTEAEQAAENADLAGTRQTAETLEGELNRLTGETNSLRAAATTRRVERDQLAAQLTAADRDLAARRAALDAESRSEGDVERELAKVRSQLAELEKARKETADVPEKKIEVQNFATPLSRPVDSKEIHFQLKHGRLAYVPLNEFAAQFKGLIQEKLWKLKESSEMTETIGPLDGFTIRYTVVREDIPWDEVRLTGQSGSRIGLDKAEFLPTSSQLGEPVDQALTNRSEFRGRLDDHNPKHTTVTVWVYPDSFEQFRFVRKELYRLGFTVAGRPMPDWMAIGGSSHGSKSAAE